MPWEYSQTTGRLVRIRDDGTREVVATGYSGRDRGLNNPDMENVADSGPIPRGEYSIGNPRRSANTGPHVMDLTPVGHNAHGRQNFQIHGDNTTPEPHDASRGCIILPRNIRNAISDSDDSVLTVVR